MKTILAFLCISFTAHANIDSLLTPNLRGRVDNEIRIDLGKYCNPCQLYWLCEGSGNKFIQVINSPGPDTIKVNYDFMGFGPEGDFLQIYQNGHLRSSMAFTLEIPIPEASAIFRRRSVSLSPVKFDRINVLGRIFK